MSIFIMNLRNLFYVILPDEGMNYEGSEMNEGMLDEGTP